MNGTEAPLEHGSADGCRRLKTYLPTLLPYHAMMMVVRG